MKALFKNNFEFREMRLKLHPVRIEVEVLIT